MKVTIPFIICVVGFVLRPTASQDPSDSCVSAGDIVCFNCIKTGICEGTPGNFIVTEGTTCDDLENGYFCDNTIGDGVSHVGECGKYSPDVSTCVCQEGDVCIGDPNNENFHINCDDNFNPFECDPENVVTSSCTCSATAEANPSSSTSTTDTTSESTTTEANPSSSTSTTDTTSESTTTEESTSDESTSSSKATDESPTIPDEPTTSDKSTTISEASGVSTTTDRSTSSKSIVTTTPNESSTTTTATIPNESTTTTTVTTTPNESTTTAAATTTPNESTTTAAATTTPNESTTTTTPTTTQPEIICPDDCPFADDPTYCEGYYQCTTGGPIPFSCPSTFCFNQEACQCLPGGSTTPVTCPDVCPFVDDPNDDCSSYFLCVSGGENIQYTCPNQRCFDEESCGCIDTSSKTSTTTTTSPMTATTTTATTTTTSRASTALTCSPTCPFVEIPDEDCQNFYICNDGALVPSQCPGDLCFDQDRCECVL